MKLAALISGGKDSIYSAYKASKDNNIICIITFKSKRDDSYMFHIPNVHLVELQAESMGIPLISVESSGIKEKELKDIKKALQIAIKKYKIEGVVSGALASNYQKERIDKICKGLKMESIAPLWHIEPEKYLRELIKNNFKIIITGIAADGLTKDFLGHEINEVFINKIKKLNIHGGGEGGEYESLVLDCPMFAKKLSIKKAKIEMENKCTGKYIVEDAELVEK
ncbi:MAG: diphthine--ammonia ligase [Nanoarchaeota archaeon]